MSSDPSPHLPSPVAPPGAAEVDLQPAKPTEVSLPPRLTPNPRGFPVRQRVPGGRP
jgi:ubiquitin carboxyl-terminal hydrolase MINDY-1/2